jgi:hypothetical protein
MEKRCIKMNQYLCPQGLKNLRSGGKDGNGSQEREEVECNPKKRWPRCGAGKREEQ